MTCPQGNREHWCSVPVHVVAPHLLQVHVIMCEDWKDLMVLINDLLTFGA